MTLKEFFRQARRGRKWTVHPYSGRVCCEDGFCPLAVVGGFTIKEPNYVSAARRLGIPLRVAHRIAWAADYVSSERPWLLKQLGVRS